MRAKIFALIMLLLFTPLQIFADDQPVNVRTSDLDKTSIAAGTLTFKFTKFRTKFLKFGDGYLEVQVENTSNGFSIFYPQRLSIVDKNNDQIDILAIQSGDRYFTAAKKRIAPGARVKEFYALTGKVQLPARLFYDEKLIAVITD